MKRYKRLLLIVILSHLFFSCEDYLDKVPVDSFSDSQAIIDTESAQAAVNGLYNIFPALYDHLYLLNFYASMSDEQNRIDPDQFTLNNVQPTSIEWSRNYMVINRANHIIEKVPAVDAIPVAEQNKFVAEAKFIRAMEYLFLTQLFGDTPLHTSSDYRDAENIFRSPQSEVYDFIVEELKVAENYLPASYDEVGGHRAYIVKGAATALLSRTYLYMKNWEAAETKATEVINNPTYALLTDYRSIYSDNSNESILEYFDQDEIYNTTIAEIFLSESLGGDYSMEPTDNIINAFETNDVRKNQVISTDTEGLVYVSKYQKLEANQEIKLIRLAEMYLIRAEARAQQGDIAGAAEDLNVIRNRAGLPNTTANDKAAMLLAIEQERFIELCFEGHRWIDIVRTGRANEIMSAFNPAGWDSKDVLLPIPQSDIDLNPNLTQNPGY